jgi:hypothetical protein
MWVITFCVHSNFLDGVILTGKRLKIAGSKVIERSHAVNIPIAVMFPRCQKGGESEKLSARKPTIVVTDVIVTGKKLIRAASIIDSNFVDPSRMRALKDTKIWIESATASVRMTVDALIEIGVSLIPKNPAAPIPTTVESVTTRKITIVPAKNLNINHDINSITINIIGVNVPASSKPTSENALFSIDTPVRCIFMSGKSTSMR